MLTKITELQDKLIKDKGIIVGKKDEKKFELENIIAWWKNKATNRYLTLKDEHRLRTELEVWTSGKNIDIMR